MRYSLAAAAGARAASASSVFRLHGRGSSDRGDREVTIGDHGLHAGRQLDRGDVDRKTDIRTIEIDGDEVGDRVGRAVELHLVAHDVEHAAALDAGRLVFVDEVNRNVDVDFRVLADAQEIHVNRVVVDRVELEVLREHGDLGAADVDGRHGGQEPAAVDLVVDILVGQSDRQGRLLVAIDDCRHFTVAADCTGGPLTDLFARFGLELVRIVAHGISFRLLERRRQSRPCRKRRKPPCA